MAFKAKPLDHLGQPHWICASHVDGALADGTYNLVPVNEEEAPEGGADVIVIEQESDTSVAQEGKPRSIT